MNQTTAANGQRLSRFNKTWLILAVIGIVLTPVCFSTGPYIALSESMAPDQPFDEKPASSLEDAKNRFSKITDEGRGLYRQHLVPDVAFFLSMGLASISLLMLAWGPGYRRRVYVVVAALTIIFMLCDGLENAILWSWFAGTGPTGPSVNIVSTVTQVKFASLMLTVPVLLIGIGLRIRRRQADRNTQQD